MCDRDKAELMKLCYKNLEDESVDIGDYFQPILPITHKDQEVSDWVSLTILKGLHIGIAEDDDCRKICGSNWNFSQVAMRNAFFNTAEIVEKKIVLTWAKLVGEVFFRWIDQAWGVAYRDFWLLHEEKMVSSETQSRTHWRTGFSSHCLLSFGKSPWKEENSNSCALIDVTFFLHATRLTKLCLDDNDSIGSNAEMDEDEDEAVNFDAVTHHNFNAETFNYFEADFEL